jgi:transcription antitermination protein NusB
MSDVPRDLPRDDAGPDDDEAWRAGLSGRPLARVLAFRIAYAADLTGDPLERAQERALEGEELSADQRELVEDVVRALAARGAEVDAAIAAVSSWPLERMAATDRAVLRCGAAELLARPGMPAPVVIDEAIRLAQAYGTDDSGAFVNGVLDQVARRLRPGEL